MLEELLHRALGITVDLSGDAPLALLLRVPSWLGNDLRHPENCEAPLDLGYAAALARREGYRAAVLDLETGAFTLDAVAEAFRSARPAAVVLSGITPAADHLLWLARAAKEACPRVLTIACGQHVDAVPESLLFPGSPVDLGVAGEFEETVAEVLGAARTGGDPPRRAPAHHRPRRAALPEPRLLPQPALPPPAPDAPRRALPVGLHPDQPRLPLPVHLLLQDAPHLLRRAAARAHGGERRRGDALPRAPRRQRAGLHRRRLQPAPEPGDGAVRGDPRERRAPLLEGAGTRRPAARPSASASRAARRRSSRRSRST